MRSLAVKPRSPALAAFIKSFHYHETNFPFALEGIIPNGQAHLMMNLAEDEFRVYGAPSTERVNRHPGAVLAGPHARSTVIDTHAQHCLAAVEFQSGGAALFLSMPMTEVCNQIVPLEDIWRQQGRSLRERLMDAPTPAAKFGVLERMLLDHFRPQGDPAIRYATRALKAGMRVSHVVSRLGLLPRTFVRRFSAQVGITPKRFARVQRLQQVLRAARHSSSPDWCRLAAEYGYTDQAHLIHDFRDLADITPSSYKPHSPKRNNHIPIAVS